MTKAYSYIRYSDPSQADGQSYARQSRDTRAYCKANGLELAEEAEYQFLDEGISAYSGKLRDDKTDLSRFLGYVQDGTIAKGSVLIVESLDRLSREHVRSALPRFMDLLNNGISIHTLQNKKTYTEGYDDMDLFQSILEMSRSHRESLYKSERVTDAWRSKQDLARSKGIPLGKTRPAWLDLVLDATGKPIGFKVNKGRVATIEKIFQYTLDGYGRNIVARMLNTEGIKAFKVENWGASSVNKILTNEAVLGVYQPSMLVGKKRVPRGEPIPNYYPPVISKDLFDQAKAAVSGRDRAKAKKQSLRFNLWQGIAICDVCESALHTYGNGRPNAPGYMRCYNAKKGVCTAASVKVEKSEKVFKEMLAKLNVLALVQSSSSSINAKLEATTGQLIRERSKLKEFKLALMEKYSKTIHDIVSEIEETIKTLEARENEFLAELAVDSIVDKEDFFSRLDLESFAGRSRANSILKRLSIKVRIETFYGFYRVQREGKEVLVLQYTDDEEIVFHPATSEVQGIVMNQEGDWLPPLDTGVNYAGVDDPGYEDEDDWGDTVVPN